MRVSRILGMVGLATVIAMVALLLYPSPPSDVSLTYVAIGGRVLTVEIADEPDEIRRGLSNRESLPQDRGMLFIFEWDAIYSFWMMNMKFNLDIIWINSSGIVVHVERNVPPCFERCSTYRPSAPAKYVLEVNSGFVDEVSLKKGSFVKIATKTTKNSTRI